jgi:hypothetical protein
LLAANRQPTGFSAQSKLQHNPPVRPIFYS